MTAPSEAAVQAELMEKEKNVVEQQQRVEALKSTQSNLGGRMRALDQERRRCDITNAELASVPQDRPVYKSLGRVFVKSTVAVQQEDHEKKKQAYAAESSRLGDEHRKVTTRLQQEEEQLNKVFSDFMASMQIAQHRAQQQQQQQQAAR